MNKIIHGDCLSVLKTLEDESVDLIYLDPPFFSNRNYEVIWGDEGEKRSFEDRWSGGMQQYISWLHERVSEMHRVLKKTGSIYLHCDHHADAYIRVQILDPIFGEKHFRNEIVWKRTNAKNNSTKSFPVLKDTIFFYSKSNTYSFNQTKTSYSSEQLSRYKMEDENGIYRCENLTAPGKSRQFSWRGVFPGENRSWCYSLEKLEELWAMGFIVKQKDGTPRKDGLKKYLLEDGGALVGNIWNDIDRVANTSKERIGYPTQKPEALLERIIKASSNKGDVVLDPFLGGGTTIAVAEKLGRKWIGIDQSMIAVKVSEGRMLRDKNLYSSEFILEKSKYEYEYLFDKANGLKDLEFEKFIVQKFGGEANVKQIGDFGIDGRDGMLRPIQVKRSEGIGRNVVDESVYDFERYFKSTTKLKELRAELIKKKLPIGTIIAFSFGKGAVEEVARLKQQEGLIIELKKVSEIVEMAKKPKIKIAVELGGEGKSGEKLVKFVCTSEEKIEVWQFDFAFDEEQGFKPSILNGRGEEEESFKEGYYCIAVKGITDFGIEVIESFKIKINGGVVKV